jgi:restriction system protein
MIPLFPTYTEARALLRFLNKRQVTDYLNMINSISELTGTPQNTVDWSNPDQWIPERLKGIDKEIALALWKETGGAVNPRHVRGCNFLFKRFSLISDEAGVYKFSPDGEEFLHHPFGKTEIKIDSNKGVFKLLKIILTHKEGKSSDFFEEWQEYLTSKTNYRKDKAIMSLLRFRLANLIDRELIIRKSNRYSLTDTGYKYLTQNESSQSIKEETEEAEISRVINHYNEKQKAQFLELLSTMNPYKFEIMIKDLLVEMGYEDVEVTQASNDKGVDVVGRIQNGISEIKEVIQVKRHRANIQRSVLDQLRGSLHRFDAFKGTIITTSDFSEGAKKAAFEKGAAPITLINGEKLIELLIENGLGIKSKSKVVLKIEMDYFQDVNTPT